MKISVITPVLEDPHQLEGISEQLKIDKAKMISDYETKKREYVNSNSWGLIFFDDSELQEEFMRENPPPNPA